MTRIEFHTIASMVACLAFVAVIVSALGGL